MSPRSTNSFLRSVLVLLALGGAYGVMRFRLGVDLTDEGAYCAWPLRHLFGEPAFTSEIMTLTRPIEVYLFSLFPLAPSLGVYGLRLLGWAIHLAALSTLAGYLFHRGAPAWRACLIAALPGLAGHLFGLAPPAYNMLSSDFLLMGLCLWGVAAAGGPWAKSLAMLAGLALVVATVAHPGLGVVAAVGLGFELTVGRLPANLVRKKLTAGNRVMLVFVAGWTVLLALGLLNGDLRAWWQRLPVTSSFTAPAARDAPLVFLARLVTYLITHNPWTIVLTLGGSALAGLVGYWRARGQESAVRFALPGLVGLVTAYLFAGMAAGPEENAGALALLAGLLAIWRFGFWAEAWPAGLVTYSLLAGMVYASATYYFTPLRSWQSGLLGLPFALALGLEALFAAVSTRVPRISPWLGVALVLLVAGLGRNHYRSIYRDAPPEQLTATFHVPMLRHIRSTPDRVASMEALYGYLSPRLRRGEPLLVFDNGPLLYFLFEARPVYGATWAARFSLTNELLAQLDRELNAAPLPTYAVRLLVDPSYADWAAAPRLAFDHYPLNGTLETNYERERTFFPFEVWRLKLPRSPQE